MQDYNKRGKAGRATRLCLAITKYDVLVGDSAKISRFVSHHTLVEQPLLFIGRKITNGGLDGRIALDDECDVPGR